MSLETAVRDVRDFESLIRLLIDELCWEIEPGALEDITFEWSADELKLTESSGDRLTDGSVYQLRPPASIKTQPWGIFFVNFADDKVYRTVLRQVLRGLVQKQRSAPHVPAWKRENLLFICAPKDYQQFTFAHFKQQTNRTTLSTFGWERGDRRLRTLLEFNLPPLHWPEDGGADANAWLEQWSRAFDKEPLTRDFFKRFDTVLDAIKADLEKYQHLSSAEAYTRSQLLLERLIFLYFLQNRGWLSQKRDYLIKNFRAHREHPELFTYYEGFLERLFWTLSSVPGSLDRLPGIPFLNGGLFNDDDFALNPIRLKRNPPLKVRNATFDRVFDELLEAFNFTVREDTPLNQEVAVDPEMLGKVFESIVLYAEAADPDAIAPDKRKATGSYYTPRIVVHFICQEVLRQYLTARLPDQVFRSQLNKLMEIDASDGLNEEELRLLRDLLTPSDAALILPLLIPKCCDPAVGSGAFSVGLLQELVNLRRVVETAANGYVDPVRKEGTAWLHKVKEQVIQDALYGVDIQQQAIEICQLRLWLSLVVDYDLGVDPFTADPRQFKQAIDKVVPLPNLEMNFRRGDSLHDHISGVPLFIHPQFASIYRADFDYIHDKGVQLHHAQRGAEKSRLRVEILERRLDISNRVLEAELAAWHTQHSQLTDTLFFDETASKAERRKRIEQEIERSQEALKKVSTDAKELHKLSHGPFDATFYPRLRRLEGADFDSPVNFAWQIDFSDIFARKRVEPIATVLREFAFVNEIDQQGTLIEGREQAGGFDIIVGNPPFVTARNPVKRELYRERWKRVCKGKYQLVCPFFELSFGLLRPGGQLGFIVSNAFAKREFGQPLVEDFFPTIDLQKVVDCSGLMFPGHGTPTCITFGRNGKPDQKSSIRVTAILPGGGDLRTTPEESPLWHNIEKHHDQPGFIDQQIVVSDRARRDMSQHPWAFDSSNSETFEQLESMKRVRLIDIIQGEVGVCTMTNADEVFLVSDDAGRRCNLPAKRLPLYHQGEELRNWICDPPYRILLPYGEKCKLLSEKQFEPEAKKYLSPFRKLLENRHSFANKTFKELGRGWYEFERMNANKYATNLFIAFPHISTHNHYAFITEQRVFGRHAQVVKLPESAKDADHHLVTGVLNSSTVLFWLKQLCFSKRESEEGATDTYFEFSGGKVEQLPIPEVIAEALQRKANALSTRLSKLAKESGARGKELLTLAAKKLFEMSGEGYHKWNSSLPGYLAPHERIAGAFDSSHDLRATFERSVKLRDTLRAEMIARQEEMDWLIYAAYGLTSNSSQHLPDADLALARNERSFVLWTRGEGDFERAASLIPEDWSDARRKLWRERLALIRDNDHIRRIEQPVYKRRWDEQWKVGNRWESGQPAYDAEFIEAFDWWLSEKAEWWFEKRKSGGPVSLEDSTQSLWSDTRVQAAWPLAAEAIHRLELWKHQKKNLSDSRLPLLDASDSAFARYFKNLVKEQTVPENIPFAVPWDDLKITVPAQVKRIRGKLNVPRERFNVTTTGLYRVADPLGSRKSNMQGVSPPSGKKRPFT